MKIVWDEPKRQVNIVTHGLDLADAESFDWETAIVVPRPYRERRPPTVPGHQLVGR